MASTRIGQMAMDQLRELDHIAFIRFLSVYQSFEDLEQLKREVDALYAERTERCPARRRCASSTTRARCCRS